MADLCPLKLCNLNSPLVVDLNDLASGDSAVMLAGVRVITPGAGRFHSILDRFRRSFASVDQSHAIRYQEETIQKILTFLSGSTCTLVI